MSIQIAILIIAVSLALLILVEWQMRRAERRARRLSRYTEMAR